MRKTVFILGAGASIEFLPGKLGQQLSTDTLTKLFTDNFDNFLSSFYPGGTVTPKVKELFFEIIGTLRKYFATSTGYAFNFEQIIHLVDKFCSVYADKKAWSQSGKMDFWKTADLELLFADMTDANIRIDFQDHILQLPVWMRNYILDYIADQHYIGVGHTDTSLLQSFFSSFLTGNDELSIFSLNYDNLLLESLPPPPNLIETGFDRTIPKDQEAIFQQLKIATAKNVFCPIHGSIFFAPPKGPSNAVASYYGNPAEASRYRSTVSNYLSKNQAGGRVYSGAMITGLDKFYALIQEPYGSYYKRLIKDLDEATTIYIIGYGGADIHINYLLASENMNSKNCISINHISSSLIGTSIDDACNSQLWQGPSYVPSYVWNNNGHTLLSEVTALKSSYYLVHTGFRRFLIDLTVRQQIPFS
jgi:hypothetical protein